MCVRATAEMYDESKSGALFLFLVGWMNGHPVPAIEDCVCDMAAECDVAEACALKSRPALTLLHCEKGSNLKTG